MKTKKLLTLLFLVIFIIGCEPCGNTNNTNTNNTEQDQKPSSKYKKGDIIYIKPDSTRCVIISISHYSTNNNYYLQYIDDNGIIRNTYVKDILIYSKLDLIPKKYSISKKNLDYDKN